MNTHHELYIAVIADHAATMAAARNADRGRMARYATLVDAVLDSATTEPEDRTAFDRDALHAVLVAHRRAQDRVWSTVCDRFARAAITDQFEKSDTSTRRVAAAHELAARLANSTGKTVTIDERQTVRSAT